METLLRTIHIGVGNRGRWPLKYANAAAGYQPVALVDTDLQKLTEASKECPNVPVFPSIDEALKSVKADAAIICTPTRFHLPQGSQCLKAGLHVLVEKGMAPNLADATKLVQTARECGRRLCVSQNYRYQAMERTVLRMLQDPAHPQYAGAPFLIEYTQNRQRPHPRTLDYPFASVWDMSCHHFDNLLAWLGLGFEGVTARAFGPAWARYEHPNNTSLQITHKSGCFIHYLHTHNAAFNEIRVRVQAEKGTIIVNEDHVSFCPRCDRQLENDAVVAVEREQNLNEAGVLADFRRHCLEGATVGISGDANLSVMALCDATCRSVLKSKTIAIAI